jgi:hypothetical protein
MGKTEHIHCIELENLDPTGGLTDLDLDALDNDPGFQRMAEEADRAERAGRITPREEALRRNVPTVNVRRKSSR